MSRVASKSTRRALRVAPSPAVAGFRPAGAALAVAAAFTLQPLPLLAQPAGGTAIQGGFTATTVGNTTTIKTVNGVGTNHSAIDWLSFSVPGGTKTWFDQPSATSTSINRVTGSTRSDIFGTLGSNGRLVLVNPNGIAFGPNASVDTAGFTASTLSMSRDDAIAGRLLFSGGGMDMNVQGRIVARNGDVVLIAPNVSTGTDVVIESNGATVLAAGQKVEITGRGLEGIRMEVQAGNQAVNLGTLKGDAVGIFAGTLTHSGVVQAQAVTVDGGKVVLQSTGGDTTVSGSITAGAAGDKGGSVDVFGDRVALLAGANIDASGLNGGGSVRVGGDYQGKNAQVPNAKATYIDAQARIKADAIQQGDGGRVIVWADGFTRMAGQISARGGALGGNGGFAEVSGKKRLEYSGLTDLRAPQGSTGSLLLDPENVSIYHSTSVASSNSFPAGPVGGPAYYEPSGTGDVTISDAALNAQLAVSDVQVKTSSSTSSGTGGQITVQSAAVVSWSTANDLSLQADKGIDILGTISAQNAAAGLHLEALNGNITSTGTLDVSTLVAVASGQFNSSGSGAGGQIVLSGVNKIGTFAASASGDTAKVDVSGLQPWGTNTDVTIGYANTSWGGHTGITGNPVTVSVATSSGGLNLSDATIQGGTVTLTTADGSVAGTVAGDIRMNGSAFIDGDNGVTIHAGKDFTVGSTSSSGYYASIGSNSGLVNITAAGAVRIGRPYDPEGSYAIVDIHGQGISIAANGGDMYLGYQASLNSALKPLSLFAKGSIASEGQITNYGSGTGTGEDALISLTAQNGDIDFASIRSTGSYSSAGMNGAKVTLSAKNGHVQGGEIFTNGGYAYGSTAGRGGDVTVDAKTGIVITNINVAGGAGYDTYVYDESENYTYVYGSGGRAGNVTLTTTAGDINVSSVNARGGYANSVGTGSGGLGGTVSLSATGGNAIIGMIDTTGGTGGVAGGKGGTVHVDTTGNVYLSPSSTFAVLADGGDSDSGQGGNGGTIDFRAGGSILVGSPPLPPDTVAAVQTSPVSCDGTCGGLSAVGGFGLSPSGSTNPDALGKGGKVMLTAGVDVSLSSVEAYGGGGSRSVPGQVGGDGGAVEIHFGNSFAGQVYAYGGKGGTASSDGSGVGGQGGLGGSIWLERTGGGALTFDSNAQLYANGGAGGDAYYGTSVSSAPGMGGNGGAITLSSTGGSVILNGGLATVATGNSGYYSDGTSFDVNANPTGTFSALGTVDVQTSFGLDGTWTNTGTVNVAIESSIYDRYDEDTGNYRLGSFQNKGTVNLADYASIDTSRFDNLGTGTLNAKGSSTAANITSNTGQIHVFAGSSLNANTFVVNDGTLNLDGTMYVGSPPITCTECFVGAAITPTASSFTNNGSIIGNGGTLSVAGGNGTLLNAGVIAPGGVGNIDVLTVQGNLVMQSGSALAVDLASPSSADLLIVTGQTTTGGTVQANPSAFTSGDMFTVVRSDGGYNSSTVPSVNIPQLTPTFDGNHFILVANGDYPSAASPAQQVVNQVVVFQQLFERQLEEHRIGKDDIVITDTACKP